MTTPLFFPANLQWVGFASEAAYGTPAAAPTVWVPATTPKWVPKVAPLPDEALRGSMAKLFGQQQGLRYDEITYVTHAYADSAYPHFLAALGTPDVITGSADPYTHKTALYNGSGTNAAQPASRTVWWFDAAGKCQRMAGAQSSNLKVDIKADALVTLDAGWMGLPAVEVTPPANTPTANQPIPAWNSTITIGGTAMSKYSEVSLVYKRATEMIPTINGSQSPFAIACLELDVTGDLTGVYQGVTDNDLTAFLANTQPAMIVKLANAGDATHSLTLQHSKVAYTDVTTEGTNKWMEVKSKLAGIANATDALLGGLSPAQAVLTSPQSTTF